MFRAGEQFDPNLDFYYLRARYLDASIGRFHNMDAFQGRMFEPITLHKYLYANVDPITMIDPSGQASITELTAAFRSQATLALCSAGTKIGAIAGRNATTRVLFGTPPKDFGLVGEFILEAATRAIDSQLGGAGSLLFDTAGQFGTAAHKSLENSIGGLEPFPGVLIEAEVFFLPDGPGGGGSRIPGGQRKRQKGAIGIDILVSFENVPVLGIDLKTGRGFSGRRARQLRRRTGVDIVEIKVDFF